MLVETSLNPQDSQFVWAVWDPPRENVHVDQTVTKGRFLLGSHVFSPSRLVASCMLPIFDQFERSVRFWNPQGDAVVYTDVYNQVWIQRFSRLSHDANDHSFIHDVWANVLIADESASMAPGPVAVCEGKFACFAPR
eukprot:TRINITY_DN35099_c0_g1_i1.p2 TRINITY_DN35099_c0_g1~~TRINITY_DN35099_c0_g1_i1.p2  ORF type:complete len:145 (+),score=15.52 TRINITY_DN35099_c0_g1_i1:25-435(+)